MFLRRRAARRQEGALDEEALRRWLTDYLADKLDISAAEIDTSRHFEEYGLDSRTAIQVTGKLEKLIERRLSPALLYDYQSIDHLARHLAGNVIEDLDAPEPQRAD